MSTAIEIETAFRSLPPREQDVLIVRLEEICEDTWSFQMSIRPNLSALNSNLRKGLAASASLKREVEPCTADLSAGV